jgi:hypothetical protein
MYARRDFCGRASTSARPDGPAIAAAPTPSLAGWAVRVVGAGSAVLNLHLDRAHPCHIFSGAGLTPAKFAPGLGSVHPNRRQLGLLLAATSAPGQGSALPQLRLGWAHPAHIFAGTGLAPAHICTRTGRWAPLGGAGAVGRPVADRLRHPAALLRAQLPFALGPGAPSSSSRAGAGSLCCRQLAIIVAMTSQSSRLPRVCARVRVRACECVRSWCVRIVSV